MKRALPLLVFVSLFAGAAFASENGGALAAMFDIPDRELVDAPMKKVEYEAPVLRLTGSPYGDGMRPGFARKGTERSGSRIGEPLRKDQASPPGGGQAMKKTS
ncbi:MAG TPA: hypothetical protein VE685_05830 [Thermoanaerobaculia bacterium]|nr:hypothetical protein [Thermoanaerobaculia bacterium]